MDDPHHNPTHGISVSHEDDYGSISEMPDGIGRRSPPCTVDAHDAGIRHRAPGKPEVARAGRRRSHFLAAADGLQLENMKLRVLSFVKHRFVGNDFKARPGARSLNLMWP